MKKTSVSLSFRPEHVSSLQLRELSHASVMSAACSVLLSENIPTAVWSPWQPQWMLGSAHAAHRQRQPSQEGKPVLTFFSLENTSSAAADMTENQKKDFW